MELLREIASDRRRMVIQAQQTADERQHLEELRRRMDEEQQSARRARDRLLNNKRGSYCELENNSRRIKVPSWMKENNNDGIVKNV